MQAELNSDVALSAANALLAHLRSHPEAARESARELGAMFGLDEPFVQQVLENVRATRRPEPASAPRRSRTASISEAVANLARAVTNRPMIFVMVTFLAMYAVVGFTPTIFKTHGSANLNVGSKTSASMSENMVVALIIMAVSIVGTLGLHMAVYFRHRRARYAAYGGAFLWLSLSALIGVTVIMSPQGVASAGPIAGVLFASMGMFFLGLLYAGFGSLSALFGAWVRIRRQEKDEERMSRQDLLERYFELQTRLQSTAYPRTGQSGPAFLSLPVITFYRKHQFLANAAIGFVLSTLSVFGTAASGLDPVTGPRELNLWLFGIMLLAFVGFLFHIFQGYLSRSAWRAAFGALCISGGGLLARFLVAWFLPSAAPEWMSVLNPQVLLGQGFDIAFMVAVSCAGYLAGMVQNRALKERNLQRNDQATLLGEMVRIQWKLSNEAGAVCVMVIDAARSSEMKTDADPLLVEYMFREYQEWIATISHKFGGRIHSTGGDGAIVAFNTSAEALSAARAMQTDIFLFNKDVNRLSMPFRLRIGLHTGEVAGNIGQVQFTEVIDIAAHVEGQCPIGSIAVSDAVATRLPDEEFIDLGRVVDGYRVLMARADAEN